jgi:DNA polymerase-3 subunit gamma/tau
MFRALLREQEDLAWAPQPFAVLEMALVRIATLPSGDDVATLLTRLESLEARLRGAASPGSSGSPGAPPNAPGRAPERARAPGPAKSSAAPANAASAEPDPGPPLASLPPAVVFDRLRAFAGKTDPGLFAALDGGELVEIEAARLRIRVPAGFGARRLEQKRAALEQCCESFFGRSVAVGIESPGEAPEAASAQASSAEALRRLRQQALAHPGVNAVLEVLDGEIVEIRPLGAPR